jgi:hypothetical protein
MLVGTSLFGTVQIEPLQQTVDRQVWIQPVQGDGRYDWNRERDFDRLSVGGTLRALRFSGWSGARYLVKVSGYPAKEVQLRSWQRSDLFLTSSFRRPVVLLRPGRELGDVLVKNPMRLEVVVSGVTNAIDFNGNAIWIGCDDDVQVPAEMVEGWERGPNRGWANVWLPAQALDNIHVRLREQETIRFRLFRQANDELYVEKVCLVRAVPGNLDFQPQEEEIDARKNN